MVQTPRRPTHIEVSTPAPGDGQEISASSAKQGTRGLHILIVLTASLTLVVMAFIAAFAFNGRPSVGERAGRAAVVAEGFTSTEPATKTP